MGFEHISSAYSGPVASNYVEKRKGSKWLAEQAIANELLSSIPHGASVLDVPVGTGRFLPFYKERGFDVHGIDVSTDMLAEANVHARELDLPARLEKGDIRALPFADNQFDLVLCVRFLNWVGEEGAEQTLKEVARVSRDKVLVGVRYLAPMEELGVKPSDLFRRLMRITNISKTRAKRWGLTNYRKEFIEAAITKAGLEVEQYRRVEVRLDGTMYSFLLLRKVDAADRKVPREGAHDGDAASGADANASAINRREFSTP